MPGPTEEGSIVAHVKADLEQFDAEMDRAQARVERLRGVDTTVKVGASTADAQAKLDAVDQQVKKLGDDNVAASTKTVAARTAIEQSLTREVTKLSAVQVAQQQYQAAIARTTIAQMRLSEIEDAGTASESRLLAARLASTQATQAEAAARVKLAEAQQAEQDGDTEPLQAAGNWQLLAAAIGAVAALIGPVTAAATAVAGGLAGMGAAGVLAVLGIKNQMKDGTAVGDEYQLGISRLAGVLNSLEQTAADRFLASFQSAESDIAADLPELNSEVGQFTKILGDAAATTVPALIDGLHTLNPLFVEGAQVVDGVAHSFETWVSSGGLQKFVDYAVKELPIVEHAVEAIGGATLNLAADLSTSGNAILRIATTLADLINLTTGYSRAIDDLEKKLKTGNATQDRFTKGLLDQINPLAVLNTDLAGLNQALSWLIGVSNGSADAAQQHAAREREVADAVKHTASVYGASQSAYQDFLDSQKQSEAQLKATTFAMQMQNDAAGLLKQALDGVNKTLDVAVTQTSLAAAENSLTDSFKQNGKAIEGNSKEAVANQQAIQQIVQAADQYAESVGTATGSTTQATKALADSKQQLESNLQSQGMLTDEVQAYIDKIFQVPDAKTTKLDIDTTRAQLELVQFVEETSNVTIRLQAKFDAMDAATKASGGTIGYAAGGTVGGFAGGGSWGTVYGPGSTTSDSIHARLSRDEEVTKASSANYPGVRPLLKAINKDPKAAMNALAGASGPVQTLDGVRIHGTLDLGNGLTGFIDGRIQAASEGEKLTLGAGRQRGSL